MTPFEYVLALISIVVSLSVTHLLAGVAGLVQHRRRVRFSWLHAGWVAITLGSLLDLWLNMWLLREVAQWRLGEIALIFLTGAILYVQVVLVTPALPAEGALDLRDFHRRERKNYVGAAVAYMAPAAVLNATLMGLGWLNLVIGVVVLLDLAVIFARGSRLQGAATLTLLLMLTVQTSVLFPVIA
jgi:hypothetical protein